MSHKIEHSGVVDSIEDGCVHVRIVQTAACAACKVAGYCNAAESKEKIIDVYLTDTQQLHVGDPVTVSSSGRVASQALLWAFGLPLLLMLVVLVVLLQMSAREEWAVLGAIAILAPYYVGLYLFRDRLREQLTFSLEKY
ncbi:MAG: SoxR reducing system RseC family protein [Prevotella sp.]|nr:SoxR reducing system RseC family protein [Prevotella sp.]